MLIYVFEVKDTNGWNDYGSTHISIVAGSEKEAWKKACEIEYRSNIIKISNIINPAR